MGISTGRNGKASFIKEAAFGTYLTPDKSLSMSSESLENKLTYQEDPRFMGQVVQTDMTLVGYEVEGNIELTLHPMEVGPLVFQTLMKDDAVSTAPEAMILIYYTGADAYADLVKAAGTITGASGAAVGSKVTAFALDTTNALYDTAAELVAAITAISGWKAYVISGAGSTACTKFADFTLVVLSGAYIGRFASSSTTSKFHKIYLAGATDAETSMSLCLDRVLGTGQAIGLSGAKVNSFNLTVSARNILKLSLGISAKTEALAKTYPSISLVQDKAFIAGMIDLYLNGVKMPGFKDTVLNVNNNLAKDSVIGSMEITEQARQNVVIQLSGTMNLDPTEWLNYYPNFVKADKAMEAILVLRHAEYADAVNNVPYVAIFRLPSVKFTSWPALNTGPNRLTVPIKGNAIYNSIYNALEAYVVDKVTTQY